MNIVCSRLTSAGWPCSEPSRRRNNRKAVKNFEPYRRRQAPPPPPIAPRKIIFATEVQALRTPDAQEAVRREVNREGIHIRGGISPIGLSGRWLLGQATPLLEAEERVLSRLDERERRLEDVELECSALRQDVEHHGRDIMELSASNKELIASNKALKEFNEILRARERQLCEREIFTTIYTALGQQETTLKRWDFLRALRKDTNLCNEILNRGVGTAPDPAMLDVLDPRRKDSVVKKGNNAAHGYTLREAKKFVSNEQLKQWLGLLFSGLSEDTKLQSLTPNARELLWERCPNLKTLVERHLKQEGDGKGSDLKGKQRKWNQGKGKYHEQGRK